MKRMKQEEGRCRILLIGIGNNTEVEKESFCKNISENYGISHPLLKKIVDRCPIILKKNLSFRKAEALAKTLKSFGAIVSIEEKEDLTPIFLEFQEMTPHRLALESCYLRMTRSGAWNVLGRAKNISTESLNDTWVLIQLFNDLEEFLAFEEVPIPINPLPPREVSPFKVVFEGELPVKKISIAFKNSSGQPLPALDRRKKREWVEVEIKGEDEYSSSSIFLLPETEVGASSIDMTEPSEEILIEKGSEIQIGSPQHIELEPPLIPVEESSEREVEGGESFSKESILVKLEESPLETTPEIIENIVDLTLKEVEENKNQVGEELEICLGPEPSQSFTLPLKEEERTEKEAVFPELEYLSDNHKEVSQEIPIEASVFEEATQLFKEISKRTEEEKPSSFPWIESFRSSIENYYQKPRDLFPIWFEAHRKEGGFTNPLHSLLTILVHARFDQVGQVGKALENTERVFRLIVQPNLQIKEIPPLEGTQFFSGENWKNLFHRAIPKLQEVAKDIFEKGKWKALDLEKLIQVIPHIGGKNSRMAVKWMSELIPDVVEIDFSTTPISIGESLYRVASRLGVVDPYFDHYQDRNSMGDLKIQSFAREAFPQDPIKIEEPMTWVGKREEGGHCFPIQPQCGGCLFETFCPRLHCHIDPSEKGMKV